MSPSPPRPTPTNIPDGQIAPPQAPAHGSAEPEQSSSTPKLPRPLIRLQLQDLRHEATNVFLDNINAAVDIADLVETVILLLYHGPKRESFATSSADATNPDDQTPLRPHPYHPHIPGTRSVTLILRDMDGVAYTSGIDIDADHKEIHFSLAYIAGVFRRASLASAGTSPATPSPASSPVFSVNDARSAPPPTATSRSTATANHAVRKELMGVICHELVHCYQHDAKGSAPGGLIEGVADYVRLKAGFVPPHWKKEGGTDWDAGYQTTGYFLDWIEKQKGEGSVRRLNEALRGKEYHEDTFWTELFGEKVGELWTRYCESLKTVQ